MDIAALAAPRPQFLGSCTGDWTKNTPDKELPFVRGIYQLHDAAEKLGHIHVDFEHSYNQELRKSVYGFFHRWLFGGDTTEPQSEPFVVRPPIRDRLVWYGRPTPPPIAPDVLVGQWRARQKATLLPYLRNPQRLQSGLVPLLPHVLCLDADGQPCRPLEASATTFTRDGATLRCAGNPRSLDLPDDCRYYLTYNPSPLVEQVHEILAALAAEPAVTAISGSAGAGPAVLLAATVSPQVSTVDVDLGGLDPTKEADLQRCFDTPALRQIGGYDTILAALSQRGITPTTA